MINIIVLCPFSSPQAVISYSSSNTYLAKQRRHLVGHRDSSLLLIETIRHRSYHDWSHHRYTPIILNIPNFNLFLSQDSRTFQDNPVRSDLVTHHKVRWKMDIPLYSCICINICIMCTNIFCLYKYMWTHMNKYNFFTFLYVF